MRTAAISSYGAGFALIVFGHWLAGVANVLLAVWLDWLHRRRFEICNDGELYLTRYKLIRTPWFRVFLHRIYRADVDRHLHNHPWPFAFSVVLWGGYDELISKDRWSPFIKAEWRKAPGLSSEAFEGGSYHRIATVLPNTWTLFFAGRRSRSWGFLVDGKHVDYREYLGLPADHELED